ncbi:MAG: ATP synthase F1 subunit delta [Acidobacteria bacterium]|nr:ATP synthase F1 subunit delta [Acidobacteriota bacterium]
MSSVETVARRYATALADVVEKTGEADSVRSEIKTWEAMIASNADLANAFGNPAIAHLKKEAVLEKLIERAKPSRTTSNFLRVLLKNGRFNELGEVGTKFDSVIEERRGIVHGTVTSAHDLSDAEKTELKAALERVTGKTVNLAFGIDKDLIGGVVARIGSTVYDSSVKTQLETLRERLLEK